MGLIYKGAIRGYLLVTLMTLIQGSIGAISVWQSVPVRRAHEHQFGGLMTITAFILAIHWTRRTNGAQINALLSKLNQKDSGLLKSYMKQLEQINPNVYEKHIKKEYDSLFK